VMDICRSIEPALVNMAGVHKVACHLYDDEGGGRV